MFQNISEMLKPENRHQRAVGLSLSLCLLQLLALDEADRYDVLYRIKYIIAGTAFASEDVFEEMWEKYRVGYFGKYSKEEVKEIFDRLIIIQPRLSGAKPHSVGGGKWFFA